MKFPTRWVPLWLGDVRCALKRKLPLILYLLPLCWTIFASFQIYLTYAAQQNTAVMNTGGLDSMVLMMKLAGVEIEVNRFISGFYTFSRLWAILAAIWYGAGLLCEDRRLGAHLLYFSRPLTRTDYVVARICTATFFVALATFVPAILLVTICSWSSPDWYFLTEQTDVAIGTLVFGLVTALYYGLIVLAISALAPRRVYAMVAVFPVILIPHAIGRTISRVLGDRSWNMLSPVTNLGRLGDEWLQVRERFYTWPAWQSGVVIAGTMVVCLAIIVWRVRRWEVVA